MIKVNINKPATKIKCLKLLSLFWFGEIILNKASFVGFIVVNKEEIKPKTSSKTA